MPTQYFIQHGNNTIGPVTSDTLRQMASSGMIGPDSLIRRDGGSWHKAALVSGLEIPSTTTNNTSVSAQNNDSISRKHTPKLYMSGFVAIVLIGTAIALYVLLAPTPTVTTKNANRLQLLKNDIKIAYSEGNFQEASDLFDAAIADFDSFSDTDKSDFTQWSHSWKARLYLDRTIDTLQSTVLRVQALTDFAQASELLIQFEHDISVSRSAYDQLLETDLLNTSDKSRYDTYFVQCSQLADWLSEAADKFKSEQAALDIEEDFARVTHEFLTELTHSDGPKDHATGQHLPMTIEEANYGGLLSQYYAYSGVRAYFLEFRVRQKIDSSDQIESLWYYKLSILFDLESNCWTLNSVQRQLEKAPASMIMDVRQLYVEHGRSPRPPEEFPFISSTFDDIRCR